MRTIPNSLVIMILLAVGLFALMELQLFLARKMFERLPPEVREKYALQLVQIHKRQTNIERFFFCFLVVLLLVMFFGPDWLFKPIVETLE